MVNIFENHFPAFSFLSAAAWARAEKPPFSFCPSFFFASAAWILKIDYKYFTLTMSLQLYLAASSFVIWSLGFSDILDIVLYLYWHYSRVVLVFYWTCIGLELVLYWYCLRFVLILYQYCIGIELFWYCIGIVLVLLYTL